jgi:D-alanine-D-alanine ligase
VKSNPWTYGNQIMLEQYIPGREFTVMVMDGRVIGALEIISKSKFYDYESKYSEGGSTHISGFDLSKEVQEEMNTMAEMAYKACLCKGVARVDFRISETTPYFLEINTQPGMTNLSLVPEIAKAAGISIEDLLERIIKSDTHY